MGTRLASELIDIARQRLQDEGSAVERWSDADLLAALNEGQVAVVNLKADAHTTKGIVTIDGEVTHLLPADGIALIRVLRNMGADEATPGRVVTRTFSEQMDAADPLWMSEVGSAVEQYLLDDEDDLRFYTYPIVADGSVEVIYSTAPARVALISDVITLGDQYEPPLLDYICYRAMNSDMANAANRELAAVFFNQFTQGLTGKTAGEQGATPNVNRNIS